MDWIGIVIFVLFMVFKALSESDKQKKQREARQQSSTPMPRRTPPGPPPKSPPPVAMPDWNFPPFFPFFEEEEEAPKPVVKTEHVKEVFIEEKPIERPRTAETPIDTRRLSRPTVREVKTLTHGGYGLEQAQMGIIWSEILSPPRALRPYRSKGYRG